MSRMPTATRSPKPPTCGRCGGTGSVVTGTTYDANGGVTLDRKPCGCGGRR